MTMNQLMAAVAGECRRHPEFMICHHSAQVAYWHAWFYPDGIYYGAPVPTAAGGSYTDRMVPYEHPQLLQQSIDALPHPLVGGHRRHDQL